MTFSTFKILAALTLALTAGVANAGTTIVDSATSGSGSLGLLAAGLALVGLARRRRQS